MEETKKNESDGTCLHQWRVSSLEEYIHAVFCIAKSSLIACGEEGPGQERLDFRGRLWFRGHAKNEYRLTPSLQRDRFVAVRRPTAPPVNRYLKSNLWEQTRFQHFQARSHHLLQDEPNNTVGWTEISQHYGGKTRYLDWSESALVALKFALWNYLMDTPDQDTPNVWVLDPRKLNYIGYRLFANDFQGQDSYISSALEEFGNPALHEVVKQELKHMELFFSSAFEDNKVNYVLPKEDFAFDGIPCLSALEDLAGYPRHSMEKMLQIKEFNPYYYLLLRYYNDALPVWATADRPEDILPPLAVLQPYHSNRIRAQQGCFTIFPNYVMWEEDMNRVPDLRSMENQPNCKGILYHIRIFNPQRIVEELLAIGEQAGSLFPDLETWSFTNYHL